MASPKSAPKKQPAPRPSSKEKAKPGFVREQIESARSHDVVFAVTGYLGSGMTKVADDLTRQLRRQGVASVSQVKVSKLISAEAHRPGEKILTTSGLERTRELQRFGDKLRNAHGMAVVAGLVIREIDHLRHKAGEGKQAFVIDCLKHPEEVKALRLVYGPSLFLVGSICDREIRLVNLRKKYQGATDPDIEALMETDAAEKEDFGQQVRKTIPLADYFVNQNHYGGRTNEPTLDTQIQRLLALVLGTDVHRPSRDERGMYAAWGAAMRSACLSRQVGAAILNPQGIVIATGTNEVPAPGGGTYGNESVKDARCFLSLEKDPGRDLAQRQRTKIQLRILGKDVDTPPHEQHPFCRSDFTKDAIYQVVSDKLNDALRDVITEDQTFKKLQQKIGENQPFSKKIIEEIFRSTPIKDLVEFSRAIHAEADAIVSLARAGGPSCQGASLYVNVFPCHLCTRQIIAAGIAEVIYIEPYPKSMASILHDDAIFDPEAKNSPEKNDTMVRFRLFSGVAPRRYVDLFEKNEEMKQQGGKLLEGRKRPEDALFVQSHRQFEGNIAEAVDKELCTSPPNSSKES